MHNQGSQIVKLPLNEHINLLSIAKGIIVSYIVTIPTFIIFAFILTYTNFPEKLIPAAVGVTTVISILTAGSTATRNLKRKGWLNGGIVGIIYMLVLYLLSSIVFKDFSVDRHVITMMLIGVLVGAIGGIIGINLKKGSNIKRRK